MKRSRDSCGLCGSNFWCSVLGHVEDSPKHTRLEFFSHTQLFLLSLAMVAVVGASSFGALLAAPQPSRLSHDVRNAWAECNITGMVHTLTEECEVQEASGENSTAAGKYFNSMFGLMWAGALDGPEQGVEGRGKGKGGSKNSPTTPLSRGSTRSVGEVVEDGRLERRAEPAAGRAGREQQQQREEARHVE